MRLLHTRTRKLHSFFGDDIPAYAILSHTWGEGEVTFQDIHPVPCLWHQSETDESTILRLQTLQEICKKKPGYAKIDGCCKQADLMGIKWVWIDTCCIDKSSSSELQEAINSMFTWYSKASVCYVFLSDVPAGDRPRNPGSKFKHSRWLARGWTLQELLAPHNVWFFDQDWILIGEKVDLLDVLSECTGIHGRFLNNNHEIISARTGEKLSWAADRQTTREEDKAYSLIGLFGVNMPMLYGEGQKAFPRLLEEIMRQSDDQTILAWSLNMPYSYLRTHSSTALPWSASDYRYCQTLTSVHDSCSREQEHFLMTQGGLQIRVPFLPSNELTRPGFCIIACGIDGYRLAVPVVPLSSLKTSYEGGQTPENFYVRYSMELPYFVSSEVWRNTERKTIVFPRQQVTRNPSWLPTTEDSVVALSKPDLTGGFMILGVWPPQGAPWEALEFAPDIIQGEFCVIIHLGNPGKNLTEALLILTHASPDKRYHGRHYLSSEQKPLARKVDVSKGFCVLNDKLVSKRLRHRKSLQTLQPDNVLDDGTQARSFSIRAFYSEADTVGAQSDRFLVVSLKSLENKMLLELEIRGPSRHPALPNRPLP
jgi:hypothetical protein